MTTRNGFLAELAAHQYGWPESLAFTYDTTRRLLADGVEGCFVECGVGAGVHPAAMARAILDHAGGPERVVHLFDSFQGVPNGGPNDGEWNRHYGDGSGVLEATGVAECSLVDVRNNLTRWGLVAQRFGFHPGWFQDTVPAKAETLGPIAFLRIDADLYESTLVCLQHLYPLVVRGGAVVVDDWNLDGCRAAVQDYFAREAPARSFPESFIPITESGDVWWTKP